MDSSGTVPSRRRASAEAVRRRQLRLRLSPAELAAVTAAAAAEGLASGAWVGQIAVRFARGETEPLPMTWRDLVGELVRFRAEVAGLRVVLDRAGQPANSDNLERCAAGVAAEVLLRRVDEVVALALDGGRLRPAGRGGSRRGG